MEKTKNIVELKNITVEFDGEIVLDNFSLSIKDKEFVTFLGPSGCGKTTTLRVIGGFLSPNDGDVFFDGVRINDVPPHKRQVNTVFQKYALFPHLNVFDNVAFGLKLNKVPKAEITERVMEMLSKVNLSGFEKRRVTQLSGGQQQRVAIARALVNRPKVLLLDEPLGALDLKLRREMQQELKDIQRAAQTTFIYVTHDQEEALTMSDTIVIMNEGVIQQQGRPEDIYNEPKNAFVADFIGASNILNGVMPRDFAVRFAGIETECLDKGFRKNQPVDVVIRPEDIVITAPSQGKLVGVVDAVMFKGVHYEIEVKVGDLYLLIHSTKAAAVGEEVGLSITPDDIHIMKKLTEVTQNEILATSTGEHSFYFWGKELVREEPQLASDTEYKLTIKPEDIEIVSSDHADIVAYLETIIYKGAYNEMIFWYEDDAENEHHLLVHSQNEEEQGTELGLKFGSISVSKVVD